MTRADIIDSLEDEYGLLCENLTEREVAIIGHITKNIRPEEIALLQANDGEQSESNCNIPLVSNNEVAVCQHPYHMVEQNDHGQFICRECGDLLAN